MPGPSEEDDVMHKLKTGYTHNEAITNETFVRFEGEVTLTEHDDRYQFRYKDLCIMVDKQKIYEGMFGEPPFHYIAQQAKEAMEQHIIDEYVAGRL